MTTLLRIILTVVIIISLLGILNTLEFAFLTKMAVDIASWIIIALTPLKGLINIQALIETFTYYLIFLATWYLFKICLWLAGILLGIGTIEHTTHGTHVAKKKVLN